MKEILSAVFLVTGAAFSLIAAVGIVKFPDVYNRMHASSKSGTLGGGCMMLGMAIHFGTWDVWIQTILIVSFFILTAPIATHVICRAAYLLGEPLWKGSVLDEPHAKHQLASPAKDDGHTPR